MNAIEERIEAAVATLDDPMPQFNEAWEKAREDDPAVFADQSFIQAASAETLAEIRRRREVGEPTAYDKLFEIAQDILTRESASIRQTGKAAEREAFQRAIERNPDLFEEWQDSLPKP
jgi:hypothetical protein